MSKLLISVIRLPSDRGPAYDAMARMGLERLTQAAPRRELYQRHQLQVSVWWRPRSAGRSDIIAGTVAEFRSLSSATGTPLDRD